MSKNFINELASQYKHIEQIIVVGKGRSADKINLSSFDSNY